MKTAYELAMERLNRAAPTVQLTSGQKQQLAELDAKYAATIAGREIALNDEMSRVADDPEKVEALRQQLIRERQSLQADLEAKKEEIRRAPASK